MATDNTVPSMILVDELDPRSVADASLSHTSEDEVGDIAHSNELVLHQDYDEEEDQSEDDGQPDEAQEWADFDPDC